MQPEEAILVQASLRLHKGRMVCIACTQACTIVAAQDVHFEATPQSSRMLLRDDSAGLPEASLAPGHPASASSLAVRAEEPLISG